MSISSLPIELIGEIGKQCKDVSTLANFSQTCKSFYQSINYSMTGVYATVLKNQHKDDYLTPCSHLFLCGKKKEKEFLFYIKHFVTNKELCTVIVNCNNILALPCAVELAERVDDKNFWFHNIWSIMLDKCTVDTSVVKQLLSNSNIPRPTNVPLLYLTKWNDVDVILKILAQSDEDLNNCRIASLQSTHPLVIRYTTYFVMTMAMKEPEVMNDDLYMSFNISLRLLRPCAARAIKKFNINIDHVALLLQNSIYNKYPLLQLCFKCVKSCMETCYNSFNVQDWNDGRYLRELVLQKYIYPLSSGSKKLAIAWIAASQWNDKQINLFMKKRHLNPKQKRFLKYILSTL